MKWNEIFNYLKKNYYIKYIKNLFIPYPSRKERLILRMRHQRLFVK